MRHGGWEVPLILIPICLLAVNQHPQPVDDCPCFEDAIAFGSVVLGSLLGQWGVNYWGIRDGIGSGLLMPGSGWVFDSELEKWIGLERSWSDVGVWWGMAGLKMVVGKSASAHPWSIVFTCLSASLRHPSYIRLAYISKVGASSCPPAYLPSFCTRLPAPQSSVLHPGYRL